MNITRAIIFGSYARGDFNEDSDIDLLLVSSQFDKGKDDYYGLLWKLTKVADYKIEPVPLIEQSLYMVCLKFIDKSGFCLYH